MCFHDDQFDLIACLIMAAHLETHKLSFFILAVIAVVPVAQKKLHTKALKMSVFHKRGLLSVCVFQMTKHIFIVKRDKDVQLTMSTFPAKSAETRGVIVFCAGKRSQELRPHSLPMWSGGRWTQLPGDTL